MIQEADIIADLHTHTVLSGHGLSTLKENIDCARARGILYLASTDHFFQSGSKISKINNLVIPCIIKQIPALKNIKIIPGGEYNLAQYDIAKRDLELLKNNSKWRLIGLHGFFTDWSKESITNIPAIFEESIIKAHEGKGIMPSAFCHIERELTKCHGVWSLEHAIIALNEIVDIAVKNNIYLEINERSLRVFGSNELTLIKSWVKTAKDKGAMFCLGTDAHFCEEVGNFTESLRLINNLGIPENQILNHKSNINLLEKIFSR